MISLVGSVSISSGKRTFFLPRLRRMALSGSIDHWSMDKCNKLPRMHIPDVIKAVNSTFQLDEVNTNYVHNVMRLRDGDYIRIFNEKSGEFIATIIGSESRNPRRPSKLSISTCRQLRSPEVSEQQEAKGPKLSLWFAPVKKDKMKLLMEKATELGVDTFQPVITQNTVADITTDAFQKSLNTVIVQSVEQCERLAIPDLRPPSSWDAFLKQLQGPNSSHFLICRERAAHNTEGCVKPLLGALATLNNLTKQHNLVVLVGPEGGFTAKEFQDMERVLSTAAASSSHRGQFVSLGSQVLRAETAVISSLAGVSLWRDALRYEKPT